MPGAFVFLSAAVSEIPENERQANHSNKARFDDSVVGDGAVLLAALAFDHLSA
jgi:hippurate hydrolase